MKNGFFAPFQNLKRHPLRSVLTASGIAIGSAMVILIAGIGAVGKQAVWQELEDMGMQGLSVSASEGLTRECLSGIRDLPMVEQAMPLMVKYATVSFDDRIFSAMACGVDAGARQVISLELLTGRMLSAEDVAGEERVCVIDESLAKETFGDEGALGERMVAEIGEKKVSLLVVGVSETGSSILQTVTAVIPHMIYVPYTTLQRITDKTTFDQIAVRVEKNGDTAVAQEAIKETLLPKEEEIGTLTTENLTTQRDKLGNLMTVISALLTAVGSVALLVSGFGILTGMLAAVHERTQEIGIKKAIGAGRWRIWGEFLADAFLLGLLGALGGLTVGAVALKTGCSLLGITPLWPWETVVAVAVGVPVLGMLFGAYPAYRAASLPPVKALTE